MRLRAKLRWGDLFIASLWLRRGSNEGASTCARRTTQTSVAPEWMHTSGEGPVGVGFSGNGQSENACRPQNLDETQRSVAPERLIIDMLPIEMRPMSPGPRCAKCDWPLAHREVSLALARASSRRYVTSTAITLSRMRRSVAAKALPCSVCAQLPTRVMVCVVCDAQELVTAQRIEG